MGWLTLGANGFKSSGVLTLPAKQNPPSGQLDGVIWLKTGV